MLKRIDWNKDTEGKRNEGQPDEPNLSTVDMQRFLDSVSRDVIVPAFNENFGFVDEAIKANEAELAVHAGNNAIHVTNTDKSNWNNKVDKVAGKGLSTEDYTTAEKNKLAEIQDKAQVNTVFSVAGKTGAVVLSKNDVNLNNIDNTPDATKNVLSATKLSTSRKINGIEFDGTNDITIFDSTKEQSISTSSVSNFWSGNKTWRDLATDVRTVLLTGLSTVSNTVINATDSILSAFGKLQAQITTLKDNVLAKVNTIDGDNRFRYGIQTYKQSGNFGSYPVIDITFLDGLTTIGQVVRYTSYVHSHINGQLYGIMKYEGIASVMRYEGPPPEINIPTIKNTLMTEAKLYGNNFPLSFYTFESMYETSIRGEMAGTEYIGKDYKLLVKTDFEEILP